MTSITSLSTEPLTLSVGFADGSSADFASVWLRDSCRCSDCRTEFGVRLRDFDTRDPDVALGSAESADDGSVLRCRWVDGHVTDLAASWLAQRSPGRPPSGPNGRDHDLWVGDFEPVVVDYGDLESDESYLAWLEELWRHGVAIVSGMPANREELTAFAERIGYVRASNYGRDWEIVAIPDPDNPVYGEQGLRVHTDLPYRVPPPGVQFNLSALADARGGESTIADGFAVADEVRREHPEMFEVLSTVDVPIGWFGDGQDLRLSAPPIQLDSAGDPQLIRFAPGLVGQVSADPDTTREAYRAYRLFSEITAEPRFEVALRLEPGDLIAMHNHRVLHGRRSFDLSTGGRRLLGCYLDVDDLLSTMRVLRRRYA
jgi:gamma-butyrobetaine dioxygenase